MKNIIITVMLLFCGSIFGQMYNPVKWTTAVEKISEKEYLLKTITKGSRPFYLSLHVGDVGHSAILGPGGTGNTTLLSHLICAQSTIKNSRLSVFD